jgi:DNA-directed RNA polymerase specialized sigma24 family protein
MEKLPESDRDVVRRCYVTGATVRNVAAELGKPFETVKSILKRSRRALFGCIQRTLAREAR